MEVFYEKEEERLSKIIASTNTIQDLKNLLALEPKKESFFRILRLCLPQLIASLEDIKTMWTSFQSPEVRSLLLDILETNFSQKIAHTLDDLIESLLLIDNKEYRLKIYEIWKKSWENTLFKPASTLKRLDFLFYILESWQIIQIQEAISNHLSEIVQTPEDLKILLFADLCFGHEKDPVWRIKVCWRLKEELPKLITSMDSLVLLLRSSDIFTKVELLKLMKPQLDKLLDSYDSLICFINCLKDHQLIFSAYDRLEDLGIDLAFKRRLPLIITNSNIFFKVTKQLHYVYNLYDLSQILILDEALKTNEHLCIYKTIYQAMKAYLPNLINSSESFFEVFSPLIKEHKKELFDAIPKKQWEKIIEKEPAFYKLSPYFRDENQCKKLDKIRHQLQFKKIFRCFSFFKRTKDKKKQEILHNEIDSIIKNNGFEF